MSSTNILKLIVALIIFFYALNGYRRGFIRTLMSMAFFLVAAAMIYFANPYVSSFLKERTPVYKVIEDKCQDIFSLENLLKIQGEEQNEVEEPTRIEQTKIIDRLVLPDILKTELTENNNAAGYAKLAVSNFEGYIAGFMANLVMNILSYVVSFLLAVLVLKLLIMTLDIVAKLPVLRVGNRLLGVVMGAVQGLFVVWILFLLITVFGSTDAGSRIMTLIGQDGILSFLYDTNIFLRILMGVFNGIF